MKNDNFMSVINTSTRKANLNNLNVVDDVLKSFGYTRKPDGNIVYRKGMNTFIYEKYNKNYSLKFKYRSDSQLIDAINIANEFCDGSRVYYFDTNSTFLTKDIVYFDQDDFPYPIGYSAPIYMPKTIVKIVSAIFVISFVINVVIELCHFILE